MLQKAFAGKSEHVNPMGEHACMVSLHCQHLEIVPIGTFKNGATDEDNIITRY